MLAVRAAAGRAIGLTLAMAFACAIGSAPAHAQVVVLVNGDPITVFDIEQRTRLEQMSSRKALAREEVLNMLIDDKLKLFIAKRYSFEVSDKDIDNSFATIAQRMHATPQQFAQRLEASGVKAATLKARLRADISWAQIIRSKYQASLQINDKDVLAALDARKTDAKDAVGYDYILRPVLFVLPRGAPAPVVEARRREADSLRARFSSCDDGIPFARALRDVAVREPITRNSADLTPQLRAIIDGVEVGHLTPPETTANGIEMFAVCAKKETTSDTPGKRALREEMFSEQFELQSKRYLKELRSAAMIEYK
jgi:peptidyl-prolyl cis-trans isomerase SurA